MTGLSSADLCKLTVQDVADLMLEKLVDQDEVKCCVYGCCDDRMFELTLCMREVKE